MDTHEVQIASHILKNLTVKGVGRVERSEAYGVRAVTRGENFTSQMAPNRKKRPIRLGTRKPRPANVNVCTNDHRSMDTKSVEMKTICSGSYPVTKFREWRETTRAAQMHRK